MQNIVAKQNTRPHQSLHQQLIVFQKDPHHNSTDTNSNKNQLSNHQIHYKINRTLKKSLLHNKFFNTDNNQLQNDPNSSFQPRSSLQKKNIQIFALPDSIANLSKLNPPRKSTNQSFTQRKLFPEEEDFLNELKQKTKIKSSRNFTKSFINDISKKNFTHLQKLSSKKIDQNNQVNVVNISSQRGNRSKTLDVQSTNDSNSQLTHPFKKQKNYLLFKKNYQRQLSENMNKFYQKFQNFCQKEHKQKIGTYNQQNSAYGNSSQRKLEVIKKPSFKQKIEQRMVKLNQKKSQKRKRKPQQKHKHKIQKADQNLINQQKQDRFIKQGQNKVNVLVKSNSNNKILNHSNKKIASKLAQTSHQKQSYDCSQTKNKQNQRLSQNKSVQENKFFFSWKGQRIHQSDKIQDSTSYLLRNESNVNKKKTKYLAHQRSMKISNNMHIVLTENNKTKINTFHNSMLLKEDPQKADALVSLVREATQSTKPQKISIPSELEINKLKIVEKNSPTSMKNSQKKVNDHIKQIVKNLKNNRKSPIQKMKTQRKYHFKIQDVQPWQITQKKSIHDSKQLFNSSFYCNSKTIV